MAAHEDKLANYDLKPRGYYENPRKDMMVFIPDGVKRTLEFGCGTGAFSYELKREFGSETWAVEINQEIDRVINKDALEALKDLPDNYFDCVLFFDVLEHLANPYELLLKLKAKLSGNGVIVCSIPNVRYYRVFVSYVFKGDWDYKEHGILDETHLRFFTYKSIMTMFDKLAFEILGIEGIHPTSSRTFKFLNTLLLNALSDVRYKHFAVVARPKSESEQDEIINPYS
jgi:2-polyprenyl-3-methyl-5-hydroxy-6-metoxy-1,4-benzoquinol methylase